MGGEVTTRREWPADQSVCLADRYILSQKVPQSQQRWVLVCVMRERERERERETDRQRETERERWSMW